jgi:hypothetical protein
MMNVNRQALNELLSLAEFVKDAGKVAATIKEINEAHDEYVKTVDDVARIKQADEIVASSKKAVEEATNRVMAANANAKKVAELADEQFKKREESLKAGEQALETARNEFNKECADRRGVIDGNMITAQMTAEKNAKELAATVELKKQLEVELAKYQEMNKKLEAFNASVKVA